MFLYYTENRFTEDVYKSEAIKIDDQSEISGV